MSTGDERHMKMRTTYSQIKLRVLPVRYNCQSTPPTITCEESSWGITLIRLAYGHVCGELSGLLIEVGAPIVSVGGTISWPVPFTLEEWRELADFNQWMNEWARTHLSSLCSWLWMWCDQMLVSQHWLSRNGAMGPGIINPRSLGLL